MSQAGHSTYSGFAFKKPEKAQGHSHLSNFSQNVQIPHMKPEIRWKPEDNSDEFIVCTPQAVQLCRQVGESYAVDFCFSLEETNKAACAFDWCTVGTDENKCFLGLSSGEIFMINNLKGSDSVDPFNLSQRSTACTCISASTNQPVIAAGFLKSGSEKSVVVLDITSPSSAGGRGYESYLNKEEAQSIDFQKTSARSLAVGTKGNIHFIDRRVGEVVRSWRASGDMRESVHVSFCPNDDDLLVSYTRESDKILLWDLRRLWKSETSVEVQSQVFSSNTQELYWTPSQSDVEFWTLHGNYDISLSQWDVINREEEEMRSPLYSRKFLNRLVSANPKPDNPHFWLTLDENKEISMFDLKKRNIVNFDSSGNLCFLQNGNQLHMSEIIDPEEELITEVMWDRLQKGYGFNVIQNIRLLTEQDSDLKFIWQWIKDVFRIQKESDRLFNIRRFTKGFREVTKVMRNGVFSLLKDARAKVQRVTIFGMEVTCYVSDNRDAILRHCGWSDTGRLLPSIEDLKNNKQYDVAAALALFQFQEKEMLTILAAGAESDAIPESQRSELELVEMAVSGCSGQQVLDQKKLWKRAAKRYCERNAKRKDCAYLRAIMHFLLDCERGVYKNILEDPLIALKDRVAFAARFLIDSEFYQYINDIASQYTRCGDLQGIMIVGMEEAGGEIFDAYLERTNDIQTVALLCCYVTAIWDTSPPPPRFEQLISLYREVLNCWQCFEERCLFDKERRDLSIREQPAPSVIACCLACGASLLTERAGGPKRRSLFPKQKQSIKMVCSKCKTMFPRCCLCLQTFYSSDNPERKILDFDLHKKTSTQHVAASWFVWCQNCCHGGHLEHIMQWFDQSVECVVAGCECRCFESEHMAFKELRQDVSGSGPHFLNGPSTPI